MFIRIRTIAGLLLTTVSSPALALEPDAMFSRLAAKWQMAGMTASYAKAEAVGEDGAIFSNITLARPMGAQRDAPLAGGQAALPSLKMQIASIEMRGFQTIGTDGIFASQVSIGAITAESTDGLGRPVQIWLERARISNFHLPQSGSGEPAVARQAPSLGEYGAASIAIDGVNMLAMDGASYSAGYDASGKIVEYTGRVPKILVDTAAAPAKLKAQMAVLGLEKMQLSISFQGLWNLDTGRIDFKQMKIEAKDAGSINLSAAFEGYTAQRAAEIAKLSLRMENLGAGNGEAKQEAGRQIMALMGELKLASLNAGFEDAKITSRLLEVQAQAMGVTPQELAASAPLMLAPLLEAAGNKAFAEQAVRAAGEFLADPGKLSFSVLPPQPVAMGELVGAMLNAPGSLIAMLNATVAASR